MIKKKEIQIKSREDLIEELIGGYWEDYDFINRQHLLAILRDEERFNDKCWNELPVGLHKEEIILKTLDSKKESNPSKARRT